MTACIERICDRDQFARGRICRRACDRVIQRGDASRHLRARNRHLGGILRFRDFPSRIPVRDGIARNGDLAAHIHTGHRHRSCQSCQRPLPYGFIGGMTRALVIGIGNRGHRECEIEEITRLPRRTGFTNARNLNDKRAKWNRNIVYREIDVNRVPRIEGVYQICVLRTRSTGG